MGSRSLWYPEIVVHQYLQQCEANATQMGWWSEDYFWFLFERGIRWRMEPLYTEQDAAGLKADVEKIKIKGRGRRDG